MKNHCYFVQMCSFNDSTDEIGSKETLACFTSAKETSKRVEAEFRRLYPSEATEPILSKTPNRRSKVRAWDDPWELCVGDGGRIGVEVKEMELQAHHVDELNSDEEHEGGVTGEKLLVGSLAVQRSALVRQISD